ncbi:MAG: tRNA lysidine(34) synthetase TilS [Proteobacteria bacterium]|nr:tRNA lysidine(34) synthetase TilS [Pseudomonadota bacterium]
MRDNPSLKFFKRVEKTISEYGMIDRHDAVLVGVSGGSDSVALIHVLCELKETHDLRIGIAHLNHSLRMDASDKDETFVKDMAKMLGLPFYCARENVHAYRKKEKLSLEDAARQLRYQFLYNICDKEGFQKIALGHTADDNAELVLMQLIRGAGLLGIGGIPPVRDHVIIRPLIHILKKDVLDYLHEREIRHVIDQSNDDTCFTRNRIRKILIPLIESSFNPNVVETLNRLSSIARCEDSWIHDMIAPVFIDLVKESGQNRIVLDIKKLSNLHLAVKRRVIRKAIETITGELKGFFLIHVDSVIHLTVKEKNGGMIDLPHRVRVKRNGETLILKQERAGLRGVLPERDDPLLHPFEYVINEKDIASCRIYIRERDTYLTFLKTDMENRQDLSYVETQSHVAFVDFDTLTFPLRIRNIKAGDRFSPLGMTGSQKLKKFFINHKISARDRKKGFILESDNRIIWVVGHRIDNAVRLSPNTQKVLKIELALA